MRIVSYNIRNVRALDRSSWWFRRRQAVARVLRDLDGDVVGLQEAYPSQATWLSQRVFASATYDRSGIGRNRDGGGEGVPIFHRRAQLQRVDATTRWFGPEPDRSGSRMDDAPFPRIATLVNAVDPSGSPVTVVNLHLDSDSVDRRTASLEQLVSWLADRDGSTVVLGDFNGPLDEPGIAVLVASGLRSVLPSDAGPTSNGFGRNADRQGQIDHIFVSPDIEVYDARIVTEAGLASDHYPVVANLSL